MSGIIPFDSLFPVASEPLVSHRLFGFNPVENKNEGITIAQVLSLMNSSAPAWSEISGKPSTFAPSAHTIGSHSDASADFDSAPDGRILRKIAGKWTPWAPDFLTEETDPTVPAHVKGITSGQISNWQTAFSWGNHAGQYRPVSWVPAWGDISAKPSTFAPSAHSLAGHSDAEGLATAPDGYLLKKISGKWTAWEPNFLTTSYSPPPDPSISEAVRAITLGEISSWNQKALEFADFPDYSIPLYFQGIPQNSGITGVFTENPYSPEDPEFDPAFLGELLRIDFSVPVKAPAATSPEELATLAQVPEISADILAALNNSVGATAENPFATVGQLFSGNYADLSGKPTLFDGHYSSLSGVPSTFAPSSHSHPLSQISQSGAANGQAPIWNGSEWAPGTVSGGGGTDPNAVHYNVADGKSASERGQAQSNIWAFGAAPQIINTNGTITDLNITSNYLVFTGLNVVLNGIQTINRNQILTIEYRGTGTLTINPTANFPFLHVVATRQQYILNPRESIVLLQREGSTYANEWIEFPSSSGVFKGQGNTSPAGPQPLEVYNTSTFPTALFLKLVSSLRNGITFRADNTGRVTIDTIQTSAADTGLEVFAVGGTFNGEACLIVRGKFASGNQNLIIGQNNLSADTFQVKKNGTVFHSRSSGATFSTRRDEQLLLYPITVTTAGTVNDLPETAGNFNYHFTAATQINGFATGENGKVKIIQNNNSVNITLSHENSSSVAANRINLIGGTDLIIPPGGVVELIYLTTISRWRLKSKNF